MTDRAMIYHEPLPNGAAPRMAPPPLAPLPTRDLDLSGLRARLREDWESDRNRFEREDAPGRSWDDIPGVSGAKSPLFMMLALAAALAIVAPEHGAAGAGALFETAAGA